MKISAYIICKNEAAVIERCIRSLKNTADEIVVVDTGSTDDTISIASGLGAVIHSIEWRDDFSYARNYALKQCSGDWVVTLDADEYLAEGDDIKLKRQLNSARSEYDGLICKLKNILPGTGKVMSQMTKLIAFRNTADISYERPIHERLLKGGKDLKLFYADGITVLHTGYSLGEMQHRNKAQRNIRLIENSIKDGAADATDYFHLTQLYMGGNRSPEEIYDAAKSMVSLDDENGSLPNMVAHRKYTLLVKAMQMNDFPSGEVMDVMGKALELFPRHPEVLACYGDELLRAKRLDHAISAYERALSAEKAYDDKMSNNFTQRAEQVSLTLADLYNICGRPVEALDIYFRLLNDNRYNKAATLGLLYIIKSQKPEEAVALLDTLYGRDSKEDIAYILGCLMTLRIPLLLAYYEKIWRTKFDVRDASMVACLLCTGNYESAVNIALKALSEYPGGRIAAMACAGIILDESYAEHEMVLKTKDEASAAVLEAFRKMMLGRPVTGRNFEPELFAAVLAETVQPLSDEQAFYYIEKAALTDEACFDTIKDELQRIRRYVLLEKLYETRAQKKALQKGQDMFLAGVYAMMRNDFARANEHFTAAMHSGFYNDEMQQYIRICKGE